MRTLFSTCGQVSELIYLVMLSTYYEEDILSSHWGFNGEQTLYHTSCSESCVLWRQTLNNYTHKYLVAQEAFK